MTDPAATDPAAAPVDPPPVAKVNWRRILWHAGSLLAGLTIGILVSQRLDASWGPVFREGGDLDLLEGLFPIAAALVGLVLLFIRRLRWLGIGLIIGSARAAIKAGAFLGSILWLMNPLGLA